MTQSGFAEKQIQRLHDIREKIEREFYFLDAGELNAKPGEDRWSILQCIEHINLTNYRYIRAFEKIQERAVSVDAASREYKMGLVGKMRVNGTRPKNDVIRWKMKTFAFLRPINETDPKARLVEHVVFEKFNQDCDRIEELLLQSVNLNWKKTRVKTIPGNILRLRLGDAYAFVVAHTERHAAQAIKVKRQLA